MLDEIENEIVNNYGIKGHITLYYIAIQILSIMRGTTQDWGSGKRG